MKPRSELIFDHAIKHVTPFSTTLGHPWVVVPDGPTRCYGWPIFGAGSASGSLTASPVSTASSPAGTPSKAL